MAALDQYGQHRHVCRIDSWNPAGLGKSLRAKLFQLLPALKTDGNALVVIKPVRNTNGFISLCPLRSNHFLTDVAVVVCPNLYLLNNIIRNRF